MQTNMQHIKLIHVNVGKWFRLFALIYICITGLCVCSMHVLPRARTISFFIRFNLFTASVPASPAPRAAVRPQAAVLMLHSPILFLPVAQESNRGSEPRPARTLALSALRGYLEPPRSLLLRLLAAPPASSSLLGFAS